MKVIGGERTGLTLHRHVGHQDHHLCSDLIQCGFMLIGLQDEEMNTQGLTVSYKHGDYMPCRITLEISEG